MKKKLSVALLASASVLLSACYASPEERYERAEVAFAEGDFKAAKLDLVTALGEQPNNEAMLKALLNVQIELADGEGALSTLDKLAAQSALPDNAAETRGEAFLLAGKPENAIETVAALTTANAARVRALGYIAKNDPAKAADAFKNGLSGTGSRARLQADYGRFLMTSGDLAGARAQVDAAIDSDSSLADVQLAHGDLARLEGRSGAALAAFDTVLAMRPQNRAALTGKIGALLDAHRTNDADELLDQIEPSKNDVVFAFLTARVAEQKGDWDGARKALQPVEAVLRDRPQADLLYAESLVKSGQAEQSLARLTSLVRRFPQRRELRSTLARAQIAAGENAAAQQTLQTVATRSDATREELQLMARAAKATGNPEAPAYAARAKAPQPERFAAELASGDVAIRKRDWTGAIEAYEGILEMSGARNPMVLNNLAYAYGRAGNPAKGLEYGEQALAQEPRNPLIMDTMAVLLLDLGRDQGRAVQLLEDAQKLAPANRNIASNLKRARAS